jgi:hypothetical protein
MMDIYWYVKSKPVSVDTGSLPAFTCLQTRFFGGGISLALASPLCYL